MNKTQPNSSCVQEISKYFTAKPKNRDVLGDQSEEVIGVIVEDTDIIVVDNS